VNRNGSVREASADHRYRLAPWPTSFAAISRIRRRGDVTFQEVEHLIAASDLARAARLRSRCLILDLACSNCFRCLFSCFRCLFSAICDCSRLALSERVLSSSERVLSSKATDRVPKRCEISRQSPSRKVGSAICLYQCAKSSPRSLSLRCG